MSRLLNILTTLTIINVLTCLCTTALGRADADSINLPEAADKKADKNETTLSEARDSELVTFLCDKVGEDSSDLCKIWLGTQKAVEITSEPSAVVAAITFFQTKCLYGSKAAKEHQKDPEMSPETDRVLSSAVPLFNTMAQKAATAIDSIKTNNFAAAKKALMDASADYEPTKSQLSTVLDRDKISYKSMLELVHYTGVSLDIAYQLVCIVESLHKYS